MIYAELKHEDSGEPNYYTLRYVVYNGDTIGTYGLHCAPGEYDHFPNGKIVKRMQDPHYGGYVYGASRDYHRIATEADIAGRKAHEAFLALPEKEQEAAWDTVSEPDYFPPVDGCEYHDNKPCICDGSSLAQPMTDDKECFMVAAMMAHIESGG